MDPVLQIFQQEQGGSAEGQGFGNFFAQGQQVNLARQRLKNEQAQEARAKEEQDVLLPLKREQMRLHNTNLGIDAVMNLQKARAVEETNAALPDIYQLQIDFSKSPLGVSDPEIINDLYKKSLRNPRAYAPGTPGGDLWTMVQSGPVFRKRIDQLKEAGVELKESGLYPRMINPRTGEIETAPTPQAIEDARLGRYLGGDYVPGAMQKNLNTVEQYHSRGLLTDEQAKDARDILFGLHAKESAAGQWMQRTEVGGLVKRREKLLEIQIEKEIELDKLTSNVGGITGTSKKRLDSKQKELDLIKNRINEVNKEIDSFRPHAASPSSSIPPARPTGISATLAPGVTGPLMDTNISSLRPNQSVRKYNPQTGKIE